MDSEPHMQLDLSHHIPGVHDGISPQLLPDSLLRSTLCQLDTQNDGIIGLPIFSSLQEQSFKVLHADRSGGSYDGLLHKGNLNTHELCLGGSSLASTSLGNLASRNGLNDQVNNPEVALHQEVPLESLRDMFSGGYTYASSSSIPTSANYGYDSLPGNANANANGNWDQNRCLMQPELSWRTSTSGLEPLQFNENQNAGLWVLPNSANDCSNNPYGTSISHNELSLSLATCRPSLPCSTSIQECCSDLRGDKGLSLGFPSNSRPTQFSQIISGSKYLGVLKQIFSDIASYSLATIGQNSISTGLTSSNSSHPFSSNHFNDPGISFKSTRDLCNDDPSLDSVESSYQEVEFKKSQLLSLLQVVDDCYNRSLDEIHTVLSAFRAATELEPQVLACFAIRTISFFYKNLRERICNEILAMGLGIGSTRDNNGRSFERCLIQKQWALQQLKRKDQQLWRPQRGLPERSVSVLRAWMFDNFLHPYPKDAEKHLLAIKSGLTRSQVSNWFINARVRLWKPLVEEMCAELNRRKGGCQNEEVTNYSNNHRSQLSIYDYNQRFEN